MRDAGARAVGRGVGEGQMGAGALQQGFGDEDAETEAAGLVGVDALGAEAGREVGLAEPGDQVGRQSRGRRR